MKQIELNETRIELNKTKIDLNETRINLNETKIELNERINMSTENCMKRSDHILWSDVSDTIRSLISISFKLALY